MGSLLQARLTTAFFALVMIFGCAGAMAGGFAPHRAAYTIETGKTRPGGTVAAVRGVMTISTEKTCEDWVVVQDIDMVMITPEGDTVDQGLHYVSRESLDGTRYRFAAINTVGGREDVSRGTATLDRPGGRGEAVFRTPAEKTVRLPEPTYFPVAHTRWIVESARAGKRHLPHNVFDGVDGEGASPAVLAIGREVPPPPDEKDPLLARPGWPVLLSYFTLEGQDPLPDYEVQALQLDNGVATRLLLDYGDFTALMKLKKLDPLPPPDC